MRKLLAIHFGNQLAQLRHAYHALQTADGLIVTGLTGTNVNDAAAALLREKV